MKFYNVNRCVRKYALRYLKFRNPAQSANQINRTVAWIV